MAAIVENLENVTTSDEDGVDRITRSTRPRTIFLKRYILPSDNHGFVGRVYELGIVGYHFETYEELSKHDDCRYAMEVNYYVHLLTRRVESLNLAGNMLWPAPFPTAASLPISFYEWLTASADVFLTRFISVVDCSLQLGRRLISPQPQPH